MNFLTRFILSRAIKRAAKRSSLINLPIATYANDYITQKIILDGWFEKRELYALEKFFSSMQLDKKICIDAGANIGNHSLFFSRIFESVVSFEPNKEVFKLLEINALSVSNVMPHNLGLSDKKEALKAFVDKGNLSSGKIVEDFDSNEIFQVEKLDNFKSENNLGKISYLKIDIEGHEEAALRGAKEILISDSPVVSLEMEMTRNLKNCMSSIKILEDCGYSRAYVLGSSFSGGRNSSFKETSIAEFKNRRPKRHKMVMFLKN
jgi:FkbM family methyltransferase